MNKSNSVITILVIILVVGILYLTLSDKVNTKNLGKNDQLTKPQENPDLTQTRQTSETTQPNQAIEPENNNNLKPSKKTYASAPQMLLDNQKKYFANVTTSEGDIKIELNSAKTPVTVNNFVFLANEGFYDKTIFHRVISGFMIQGGDPLGTGMGGPGYSFKDEAFDGEYTRGTIAMANSGANTNGSQFFIMHQDYPLPKNYVIFGKVVNGMEVVDKIAEAKVTRSRSGESSQPVNPVSIISVKITNN